VLLGSCDWLSAIAGWVLGIDWVLENAGFGWPFQTILPLPAIAGATFGDHRKAFCWFGLPVFLQESLLPLQW